MATPLVSLPELCDELLLHVFSHLDVPDLLAVSRTNHRLRSLSRDPILHARRLHSASSRLSLTLAQRPALASLLPPAGTIYLSTTHVLARKLSRKLVEIRLNRNLSRRPPAAALVECNILPPECCGTLAGTGEVVWGGGVAPGIVEAKRRVERERLKDGLRAWLARLAVRVEAEGKRRGEVVGVKGLVRRFTARRVVADGREARARGEPTRAHVLGLRRFWEGMARAGEVRV